MRDRVPAEEVEKWRNKIFEAKSSLVITGDTSTASQMLENIEAYISDSHYFQFDQKDLVLAFEAIVWAWAWLEIGRELGIFSYEDAGYYEDEE